MLSTLQTLYYGDKAVALIIAVRLTGRESIQGEREAKKAVAHQQWKAILGNANAEGQDCARILRFAYHQFAILQLEIQFHIPLFHNDLIR